MVLDPVIWMLGPRQQLAFLKGLETSTLILLRKSDVRWWNAELWLY